MLYRYYHNTMSFLYNIIIYGARVARGDGAGRLRPLRQAAKTVLKSAASGDDGSRVQRRAARATVP